MNDAWQAAYSHCSAPLFLAGDTWGLGAHVTEPFFTDAGKTLPSVRVLGSQGRGFHGVRDPTATLPGGHGVRDTHRIRGGDLDSQNDTFQTRIFFKLSKSPNLHRSIFHMSKNPDLNKS